jgi:hypothetical protein
MRKPLGVKTMNVEETLSFITSTKDVNAAVKAFEKMCRSITKEDLPILIEAIQSKSIGFAIREWLAEPIITLEGPKAISILMKALRTNFEEGHDNDSLQGFLSKLAKDHPNEVKRELLKIKVGASDKEIEDIEWLLEFCK